MKIYTDFSQLPLILTANELAQVLRISRANAYVLMHAKDFPTYKIGKRLVVRKDKVLEWMEQHLQDIK